MPFIHNRSLKCFADRDVLGVATDTVESCAKVDLRPTFLDLVLVLSRWMV